VGGIKCQGKGGGLPHRKNAQTIGKVLKKGNVETHQKGWGEIYVSHLVLERGESGQEGAIASTTEGPEHEFGKKTKKAPKNS